MADALDTIVSVEITRETRTPSQRGFGVPLIVAYHEAWADRVKSYSDAEELTDDGFDTDDFVYTMFSAMKAQSPSPDEIRIGRCATGFQQTVHLIPTVLDADYKYEVAIDGATFTYTVLGTEGVTGIVDAFVTGISGTTGLTIEDGTTWAVVKGTTGAIHSFVAKRGLDLYDATGTSGLTADLAAIAAADELNPNGPAYGWLLDCNSEARIGTFSTFIESRIALGVVQSADWDVRDAGETGDVATALKTDAITRTTGIYHSEIGEPIAAAWMAKELPKNPGQSTWAHKTLATIAADSLTSGERTAIEGKRWSWYSTVGGVNITFEGKTPAGEYADIIHQVDFVTARAKEAIFGTLVNNDKVAQTDAGIDLFRAALYGVLKLCSGAEYPIFDPTTIVVDELKIADTETADRVNRTLRGLKFEGRLQGAFHKVVVKGRVYV